jgi:hypothetical protein
MDPAARGDEDSVMARVKQQIESSGYAVDPQAVAAAMIARLRDRQALRTLASEVLVAAQPGRPAPFEHQPRAGHDPS